MSSSDEASQIIRLLSRTAVDMNLSRVVTELGQAEAIGCQLVDPLQDVPEVNPVTKLKVRVAAMESTLVLYRSIHRNPPRNSSWRMEP